MVKRLLGLACLVLGCGLFLYPGFISSYYLLTDKGLKMNQPSTLAFAWHKRLHSRYEAYCRERVRSGVAASLEVNQLEETEWPLFGSCFFLWSTENLQAAWEANASLSSEAPAVYARGAIEAATALVLDPSHAKWVRDHWGEDYLHHENVFYRMLYISAICSHHRLTGSQEHLVTLASVVDSLVYDLNQASHGLLEDYPGECYPADVMVSLVAVKRASAILGEDRSAWLTDFQKHFVGELDHKLGLPSYFADASSGTPYDASRGCANSYLTTFGPELWPGLASKWFERYQEYFWQDRGYGVGFREFGRGEQPGRMNLDSGPIIDGFGVAATAFGLSACRANGRYDLAYPLTGQMLVASWPLPVKGLLIPNVLSNQHAPLLGEASIVFQLSQRTNAAVHQSTPYSGSRLPWSVYVGLAFYFLMGTGCIFLGWRWWRRRRNPS